MFTNNSIAIAAGLAASIAAVSAAAGGSSGAVKHGLVPQSKAGVLYINLSTGERALTLYSSVLGSEAIPRIGFHSTVALFDYWMSINENPCWTSPLADGFGWGADATTDHLGPSPILEPIVGWDYGDMPFDSKITGVLLRTAVLHTESVDSNGDGVLDTGVDTVAVYYDALSEGNATSIAPPTAAVRIESIPGNRGDVPAGVSSYDLVLDFGSEFFELGDSDGKDLGSLWLPGAAAGQDVDAIQTTPGGNVIADLADGLADIQYLQYYAKHATNAKVTSNSTFIGLGMPDGTVVFTTHTASTTTTTILTGGTITTIVNFITVTESFFVPDALPAGQGVKEGLGIGTLGQGGDSTSIKWLYIGWFGGMDCAGFLDQIQPDPALNPTYYNFTPFTQIAHGFFSDTSSVDPCLTIDINSDGILDHGDIKLWVQATLAQDLSIADMNGDGVLDNGDIGTFVQVFLACTG